MLWIEPRPLHKPGRYSTIELYPCVSPAPLEFSSDYLGFCGTDKFNLTKSKRASSTFAPTKGLVPTSLMVGQMGALTTWKQSRKINRKPSGFTQLWRDRCFHSETNIDHEMRC